MAWKLTGSPYLFNTNMQVYIRQSTSTYEIDSYALNRSVYTVPQDWLCKNPECLDVYPCDESLTEVYFKPTHQRTLRCRSRLTVIIITYLFSFLLLQMKTNQGPGPLKLLWGWWVLRLLINIIVEDFIMFNRENLDSCMHTNCFFLSVERRVISSLSAFISSSLYWKSRTTNLKKISNTGSAFLSFSWKTWWHQWTSKTDRHSNTLWFIITALQQYVIHYLKIYLHWFLKYGTKLSIELKKIKVNI